MTLQPGLAARRTAAMREPTFRLVIGVVAVCLSTWLALLAAGNVGLQRSISLGALTLFEQPIAVALVAGTGFVIAYICTLRLALAALPLAIGVLMADALAGLVLAPIAVGELEPIHAPLVIAAVSVLGIQPAAALVGALLARHRPRDVPAR